MFVAAALDVAGQLVLLVGLVTFGRTNDEKFIYLEQDSHQKERPAPIDISGSKTPCVDDIFINIEKA